MSRQRGHRRRPAPERRAIVEKYSRRPARPARAKSTETPRAPAERSRWTPIMVGTLLSVVMYGLVASALVAAADGDRSLAGWLAAGASAMVPVLLAVLGKLTGAGTPMRTAWMASPAVLGVFLAGGLVARDVATGYVLAVGAGASYAMRLDEAVHRRRWRLWTTAGLALYTKVTYVISASLAVSAAPLLPIIGISIVDSVAERRGAA